MFTNSVVPGFNPVWISVEEPGFKLELCAFVTRIHHLGLYYGGIINRKLPLMLNHSNALTVIGEYFNDNDNSYTRDAVAPLKSYKKEKIHSCTICSKNLKHRGNFLSHMITR